MKINYLDNIDLQFLDKISPFPEIEESLNYIITNNNFRSFPQPILNFRDTSDINKECFEESTTCYPQFELSVVDPKASLFDAIFRLSISIQHCDIARNGISVSNLLCGRFSKYFEYHYSGRYEATLAMPIPSAVSLMTYCLSIYGYKDLSNLKIVTFLDFTSSDQRKIMLPESLSIPITFRKAFAKLKKISPGFYDFLYLHIAGKPDKHTDEIVRIHIYDYLCEPGEQEGTSWEYVEHWGSIEELERRRNYRNFDSFSSGIEGEMYFASICLEETNPERPLRFFTDYFLFLNPNLSIDDMVVSIDFSEARPYDPDEESSDQADDVSDWLFSFYPDDSEDSPEKLKTLTAELEKLREATEKADKEAARKYANLEGYEETPREKQIGVFLATPLSEAIETAHLSLDKVNTEVHFYDADDRLVMTMSKQYMSIQQGQQSNIKTVCTFYLTPEKRQIFDTLYFSTRHQRYEYESSQEGISEQTVCLQGDTHLATHYISYWLTSIGSNPSSLRIRKRGAPG